jgi:hypothetical protein
MNKINQIKNLLNEASKLDSLGQYKKANDITNLFVKLAQEYSNDDFRTGEPEPQTIVIFSDIDGNEKLRLADGSEVDIPKDLKYRDKFAEKEFLLSYNPDKEQFLYVSDDRKTAFPLDELDKVKEIRGKKVDVWRQIGLRGLFGDMRLPNLNKIIPLEPFVRKSVIDLANDIRPLGDDLKQPIRTNITDPATRAIQDLGGNVAGGKTPEFSDAERKLGKSEDRTSTPSIVPETTVNVPGSETPLKTPAEISDETNGNINDDSSDPIIKSNGKTLRDIKSPKDLLFWSMMVANRIPFSSWSKEKENEYYSSDNFNNTLSMINKLTSSNWVKRTAPQIAQFKQGAIDELNSRTSKTASKTTNRQILASMNEICEELESLGMHREANDLTDVMIQLAAKKTPGKPYDLGYVQMHDNNIIVVLRKIDSDEVRSVSKNPKTGEPFKDVDEAYQLAMRNALDVDILI